ncbi:dihydrofolate reductase family protein [Paenibacillus sacheonensis]|uniref:dihydrofolate reductase family protein n=1 Tax=Paenibacillus sacheonensis TaxID=742054 RepID=UPI0030845DAC
MQRLATAGKTLLVNGGPGLGSTLAQLGLADEYHILIQPIVAGHGPQLLGGVRDRLNLKLSGSHVFGSGVAALHARSLTGWPETDVSLLRSRVNRGFFTFWKQALVTCHRAYRRTQRHPEEVRAIVLIDGGSNWQDCLFPARIV